MQIYLLRHGQTISPGTYSGVSDTSLSRTGESQILNIADFIKTIELDGCYSSPLVRCKKTFELLGLQKKCVVDPDLKEINFGSWEGRTFNEIYTQDRTNFDLWMKEKETFTFPGGDNILDFSHRVKKWFEKVARNKQNSILVIGHSGFIRYGICHLLGLPIDRADNFAIKEGCVSNIYTEDAYSVLQYLNTAG